MMHMVFWCGYNINDLLFKNLNISSVAGLFLACVCIFGFAIFYESLKVGLAAIKLNSAVIKAPKQSQCFSDDLVLISNQPNTSSRKYCWTLIEALIYTLELSFGYVIMLLVMTYNIYVVIASLMAAGVCYFIFGHRLMELKLRTSQLKLPCEQCIKNSKDSNSSSTEVITESVTELGESTCCSHPVPTLHYI